MDDRDVAGRAVRGSSGRTCGRSPTGCSARPEAEDAVQEAWLRLSRADAERRREPRRLADHGRRARVPRHAALARNARARSRSARDVPEPVVERATTASTPSTRRCWPTRSGSRCSSCSRRSTPAERLAFVLHDMFAVPFDEIAPIVDRTPAAARQLASRARRRVQRRAPAPDADLAAPARGRRRLPRRRARRRLRRAARGARPRRRAARRPRRAPRGASSEVRGAEPSPAQALTLRAARAVRAPGARQRRGRRRRGVRAGGRSRSRASRSRDGRIVEIDMLADPARLRELDLSVLDG